MQCVARIRAAYQRSAQLACTFCRLRAEFDENHHVVRPEGQLSRIKWSLFVTRDHVFDREIGSMPRNATYAKPEFLITIPQKSDF
ncbi:MAG: hypothetical protein JWM11_579 [Planctomycetaceae bacterium]|nr:hypothetical protein [Planctomycetaceae bacterium]